MFSFISIRNCSRVDLWIWFIDFNVRDNSIINVWSKFPSIWLVFPIFNQYVKMWNFVGSETDVPFLTPCSSQICIQISLKKISTDRKQLVWFPIKISKESYNMEYLFINIEKRGIEFTLEADWWDLMKQLNLKLISNWNYNLLFLFIWFYNQSCDKDWQQFGDAPAEIWQRFNQSSKSQLIALQSHAQRSSERSIQSSIWPGLMKSLRAERWNEDIGLDGRRRWRHWRPLCWWHAIRCPGDRCWNKWQQNGTGGRHSIVQEQPEDQEGQLLGNCSETALELLVWNWAVELFWGMAEIMSCGNWALIAL